ncbi:MAG: radical SAM protein [Promethearchaeota archaeon]
MPPEEPPPAYPEESSLDERSKKRVLRTYWENLEDRLESIKLHIFARRDDMVLVVRPLTMYHVNEFVVDFLEPLYTVRGLKLKSLVAMLGKKYSLTEFQVLKEFHQILDDISALIRQDPTHVMHSEIRPLRTLKVLWPTMAEISITESCNNRCRFCYMGCPGEDFQPKMSASVEEFELVIDKLWYQAKTPSLNFTGGEPTTFRELPELVQHAAELGFKVVVITNGRRLADESYLLDLIDSGVNGFQVSIEAAEPELHDHIVNVEGAWAETVRGIKNCVKHQTVSPAPDFWVSTNTTISKLNRHAVTKIPAFVAGLGAKSMSMNMIIWSGLAMKKRAELGVYYSDIGPTIRAVKYEAEQAGIKFSWLSPTAYCLFNPVMEGLGYKGCSCYGGLVSIDCQGNIIPCSSALPHWGTIGNLVHRDFWELWNSEEARGYREHRHAPESCRTRCPDFDVCGGACPIYWEVLGTDEIEREMALVGGTFADAKK